MKYKGFIEILSDVWYCEKDGTPWSSKNGIWGKRNYLKRLICKRQGYYSVNVGNKPTPWHRLVYGYFFGIIPKDMTIDHINNRRDDNRICNLQLLSSKNNCRKCSMYNSNKSGFAGVSFIKSRGKYMAAIKIDCKTKYLGIFNYPEDAYQAYLEAKIKYHGKESITPL